MSPLPPSNRGWNSVQPDLMIDLSRRLAADEYHPTKNPKGIVDMGSAINDLMQEDLGSWVQHRLEGLPATHHLQYNDTQGSRKLLNSVANFMNWHFRCHKPLGEDNILIANGVTSLLNSLAFAIADEGSSILLPTPSYGMFSHDIITRNSLSLVPVACDDIVVERFQCQSSNSASCWQSELVRRLEKAFNNNILNGRKTAAVLLANPENPLGRCYDSLVLVEVSRFCEKNQLHLIVDEIYAATAFSNHHSMLSLDLGSNMENVHVIWGMSKDFGCGGLRLGFLATYNTKLHAAMRTLSMFSWVSAWSAAVASLILEDRDFLRNVYFPTLKNRLETRRNRVMAWLTRLEVPFVAPEAGFFVFVDLSKWLNKVPTQTKGNSAELEFLSLLMTNRVFLEPGQAFFSAKPGWFRLNFGKEERTVDLGLQRLAGFLQLVEFSGKIDDSEDETFEKFGSPPRPGEKTKSRRWRHYLCFGSGDYA